MSEALVPELRFDGFDEEWSAQALGDFSVPLRHNSLSRAELTSTDTGMQNIHYGDVLVKFPSVLDFASTSVPFVSNPMRTDLGDLLSTGDVVFADAAEDETVGRCCELLNAGQRQVVSGLHTIAMHPMQQFGAGFLGHALNADTFHDQLVPLMQGTKVSSISTSALSGCLVRYPTVAEQESLGSLFQNLDSLISQHRSKWGQLQQTKAALMHRMFPKEGADEPELRFEGFSGAWERTTLGSVAKISSAARVHKSQWKSAGVPFYRASDVTSFKNRTVNPKAFISFDLYEKLTATSGRLQKGDLLVVGGGTVGVPYIVPTDEPLYSKDADLLWLKPLPSAVSEYLATYLTSQGFQRYLKSISHSGTIAHYTIVQAKGTALPLPSPPEQQAIGAFFTKLDDLITSEQSYIDKLRQVKSALLQKMFV